MGGKPKTTQRTKGNLKPAKSANFSNVEPLDASLLSPLESGLLQSSLVAFGVDDSPELFDNNVDQNFQIILRKMSKKDPTTKIKALKEFIEQVNLSELDIVLTAVHMYARIYVQLSTDVDARVREGAQNSLLAVVNKIGKNLATILKQIFPSWICSQYDTHPTASSIATNCFQKAFPLKKVSEVFCFCEAEVLETFTKNLTILNPQTICNVKTYSPEECEAKYERVLIASLRGYAMYLEKVPTDKIEKSIEKNLGIVSHDKFWSLHKNKSPYVRSAFFEAITAMLQYAPFLLKNHEQQLTSIAFKMLDESDPSVLSHVWTSILLIQIKVDNWWTYINISKMFLPKLWKILRTCLYPCIIYPNLLPLVSKFNNTILPEDQLQNFHEKFFENLNFGLRNVQLVGKSEITVVSTVYYEILQYIIVQIVSEEGINEEDKLRKCNTLIDDHIIAVVFWCINSESVFGKSIFSRISNIIKYWSKHSTTNSIYRQLLDRFWIELYQVLAGSLESNNNLQQITNGHLELVKNLKSTTLVSTKSVKIQIDEKPIEKTDLSLITEKVKDMSIEEPLIDLVKKLSSIYVEKIDSTMDAQLIENLEILIKEYQSKDFFKHLASNQQDEKICSLYDTFAKWLHHEDLRCESIVEIILVLYKYLECSEKIDLLNRWIRVPTVQKNWLILRALSYPFCVDAGITKFLKMKEVTDHLAECARQVANGNYKDYLMILQKCFFQTENGDILIDIRTCGNIVDILSKALVDPTKINQMDQCGSFLAQIFPTICSDHEKKDIQVKIFLSLFDFSINKEISDDISEDTMWEIITAWQDALSSGDLQLNNILLEFCCEIINEKLEGISMESITTSNIERLAELTSKLIMCSTEDKHGSEKNEATNEMLSKLLNYNRQFNTYIESLSTNIELIRGELTFDKCENLNVNDINFNQALDGYMKYNIFHLNVVLMLSCNIKKKNVQQVTSDRDDSDNEEDEIEFSEMTKKQTQDEEEITEDYCDLNESLIKEWSGTILDKFLDVSYCEVILNTLLVNIKNLKPEFENWIIYMQERLRVLIENLPETIQSDIKETFFELANKKGGFHARSLHLLLYTKDYKSDNGKIRLYEDSVLHSNKDENMLSYINILQTFDEIFDKKTLPIAANLLEKYPNLLFKLSAARSLMKNHLVVNDFNEMNDRKVVGHALILMNEVITTNKIKPFLLYNKNVAEEDAADVLLVSTIANFISDILTLFPSEIDVKRWDFIRIALSSWVLSVSKSSEKFSDEKVKTFIVSIFKLNASLQKFITTEKTKSSTQMLQNVIDEWENLFSKDVNLVIIKAFIFIIKNIDYNSKHHEVFVDALCPFIEYVDFSYVLHGKKIDSSFTLNDLIEFALENLSNRHRGISITAATILRQLTLGLIKFDHDILVQRNSEDYDGSDDDDDDMKNNQWHIMEKFKDTLESYQDVMKDLIEDFSFKANEIDYSKIPSEVALPYLLIWHCILNFCSVALPELRSTYARWISIHHYEDTFLLSLFKLMPRDLLKNPDISTKLGHAAFTPLKWSEIQEDNVNIERYAAFLYAESLRVVPAIVRKWWHSSNTRQAHVIDKITVNYVSPILCNEDLTVLTNMKDRDGRNSMHIRVLVQAREVIATYLLDEARMELVISLSPNYPLGPVKVECKKHIGGKFQAREMVKQLSIYLTHQNGRLYDGIYIWKGNLDRKYDGVEECYICYSVIHQENLQLPRLTCKTCKKKFHSSCLYRWFTSSNKSTCPLCRNQF